MELSSVQNAKLSPKVLLKWAIVALIVLVNLDADVMMYMNGDIAYPILDLVLVGVGVYVFMNKKMYAQRYAFPSVAGMTAFIIFPLVYTVCKIIISFETCYLPTLTPFFKIPLQ